MNRLNFKVPPVTKMIQYAGSPEAAFDRFTLEIASWWPLATHSIGKAEDALSVSFERLEVGGALVERTRSGELHVWGSIITVRRPRLISFTWHVGRKEDTAQLIEVTFEPDGVGGSVVQLTHSGWERLGEGALEAQRGYNEGWNYVLARYEDMKV